VDRILVAQPIGSLHCVVHVPLPVVVLHVAQGCIDATLSGDCVRTCGEEFCDDGSFEAFSDETESSAKSCATWTKEKSNLETWDSKGFSRVGPYQLRQPRHRTRDQSLGRSWKWHRCSP
jgi:hypothetical protein